MCKGWDSSPTVVLGDNDAAVTLALEDLITAKNRFYTRVVHYAKQCFEELRTLPMWVPTKANLSDGTTKAVDHETFASHFAAVRGLLDKPVPDPGLRRRSRKSG